MILNLPGLLLELVYILTGFFSNLVIASSEVSIPELCGIVEGIRAHFFAELFEVFHGRFPGDDLAILSTLIQLLEQKVDFICPRFSQYSGKHHRFPILDHQFDQLRVHFLESIVCIGTEQLQQPLDPKLGICRVDDQFGV